METRIVYFDETGDDGNNILSSRDFVLTSIYMPVEIWQDNFDKIRSLRKSLKEKYGFPVGIEMHTKAFLTDKNPYRNFGLSVEEKQEILIEYIKTISNLEIKVLNVIINKEAIKNNDYPVLENALKYNIQRIENDSNDQWKYFAISDEGRIKKMNKTARQIRKYNPIESMYSFDRTNHPVHNMIEDILQKESKDSSFIQVCDFISYFVHLYYDCCFKKNALPNRVSNVIDTVFIKRTMTTFDKKSIFNLNASKNEYGLVVYPK